MWNRNNLHSAASIPLTEVAIPTSNDVSTPFIKTATTAFPSCTVPLLDKFIDRLAFLSPRTWYGIIDSQTRSPFNNFDGVAMLQAAIAIVIPLWCLAQALDRFGSIRQKEYLPRILFSAVWFSPWNGTMMFQFVTHAIRLVTTLWFHYHNGRMEALESAIQTRNQRIKQHRLQTKRRYDVYWPTSEQNTRTIQHAILILPGFGISHWAYSEVASRLSDSRFVVVVASMEPVRMAHPHLGSDAISMARILQCVQRQQRQPQQTEKSSSSWQWHLLGHSAGSFAAMHLYKEFSKDSPTPSKRIVLGKLILWGCSAMMGWSTDISQVVVTNKRIPSMEEDSTEAPVLILQGTQDTIVELMKGNQDQFEKLLPIHTRTEWILGGTHQGFASYHATWEGTPSDASAISYQEQQRQACEKTVSFIFSCPGNPENLNGDGKEEED